MPDANIVLGGSGANRTVTVTPVANQHGGPVTVTVTVSDGGLSSSDTFTLSVTSVNDAPTIDPIANHTVGVNVTAGPLPIAIADVDHAASGLTLSAVSSNQALVPDTAIAFGGSDASRTVTITPLPDQSGQTTITVTVSDGVTTTSTAFVLTVTPRPPLTYFLAEGATGDFFDEDLLIANPNDSEAPVTVTFYPGSRASIVETRTIPARSGLTLQVDALPGLEAAAVSAQVTSESGAAARRRTHAVLGRRVVRRPHGNARSPAPATRWYFAEGAQGYFDDVRAGGQSAGGAGRPDADVPPRRRDAGHDDGAGGAVLAHDDPGRQPPGAREPRVRDHRRCDAAGRGGTRDVLRHDGGAAVDRRRRGGRLHDAVRRRGTSPKAPPARSSTRSSC